MPPKAKIPAPIDRPLSRAYLREFTGWSNANPPGVSDPTSLSSMKNCYVTRNGALAVRPGLRRMLEWPDIVGSFEAFFLADGSKAILYARRNTFGGHIEFATANVNASGSISPGTMSNAGFTGAIPTLSLSTTYVRYMQIDNKIFALPDSTNANDTVVVFYVGATKRAVKPRAITQPGYDSYEPLNGAGAYPIVFQPIEGWCASPDPVSLPSGPAARTTSTIVSSDWTKNVHTFGFFYTFSNELGESAPSPMTLLKVAKPASQWNMTYAYGGGGAAVFGESPDGNTAVDQLFVLVPPDKFAVARDEGAVSWNLYATFWSNQSPRPPEAVRVATREILQGDWDTSVQRSSWVRFTAQMPTDGVLHPTPARGAKWTNYSDPPRAAQGLIAGDRLILVNDRKNPGAIRWSSNQQGDYSNFSSSAGGGYKTLTSGNMQIPVVAKLWQNPQSVDTITILCNGVDGYSTAYYMAPASVAGQTGSTQIMGFEETTATPGTTSPYGCEVVNQALYHPLDEQLMKSTAANYNISHKTMTEEITHSWTRLRNKQNIVSAQLDNRIYFIVDNPDGIPVPAGEMGNEIWVIDVGGPTPVWSRWMIPARSLRRFEFLGRVVMSVTDRRGVFVFDDQRPYDDERTQVTSGGHISRPITWSFETNTQGANRAHDAWAHLQQVNIVLGNFSGRIRYGVRGLDSNGHPVDVAKIWKDERPVDYSARPAPWDIEDFLLVQRGMKEWRLYGGSVTDPAGATMPSYGQINLVQYRYTPLSVNPGYEYGSIESFEYGRASSLAANVTTNYPNGIPAPVVDYSR